MKADPGGPYSIERGKPLRLDGSKSSGRIGEYRWTFSEHPGSLPADWTTEINYLANSDGSLMLSLTEGAETKVPVRPGLNRVFVRLSGAGDAITVRANTAATASDRTSCARAW